MFLPWSLFARNPQKSNPRAASSAPRGMKSRKATRSRPRVEELEDRNLLATFHVDISHTGIQDGSILNPFRTIQQGLLAAQLSAGADEVIVYGNNTGDPANVYVWDRDGDANLDGTPDGNMLLSDGGIVGNNVNLTFRAQTRVGEAAPLIVKMLNNIIDVGNGNQLRVEGNSTFQVIFTSLPDDAAGGDTNGDGNINAPNRADWGGIRFRAGAEDQGVANPNVGSIVNWADIRYTGQSLFDEITGDFTEFASIRMEGDPLATDPNPTVQTDIQRAQIRVWNTIFRNGGRALDVHLWSLQGDGPDLGFNASGAGGLGAQPLTFVNNSINGAFINIPFVTDPNSPQFGQVVQLDQDARLDDVGVPYVLTQRFVLAHDVHLTIDPAIIIKSQRVTIDGVDAADVNDATSGHISVNGVVERPVIFTSLADDNIFLPDTLMSQFYSNGSADTNNDGSLTAAAPGDWGGIRISQGNIDHAYVKFGGGLYPLQGTFVNTAAVTIFSQDRTGIGGPLEQVRVANTDISQTFTGTEFGNFYESAALEIFARDWNPNIQRTGDIAVIDNNIHDNQGRAIYAHPLAFHDRVNPYGGYGVHFRRNIMEDNANNGVYLRFILDLARGVDRNISRVGGYFDDTDIVHVLDGQMLLVHQDQAFQMMSRRGVEPGIANGGLLDRYSDVIAFLNNLTLQLPGIPAIPLERGPNVINPTLVDSGLYYNLVDFETTARQLNLTAAGQAAAGNLYGSEWLDWGASFTTGANQDLKPFYVRGNFGGDADPSGAPVSGNGFLAVKNDNGDGSFDITFPNGASAVGFWIVDNETTSPNERIEFIGVDGQLIESIAMPTTTQANNRAFVGRVSKQPIWKVRIFEDKNDSVINNGSASFASSFAPITIPDAGASVQGTININVPGNFNISDLNVKVNITHPRASDLVVQLQGPDNTIITLANRAPAAGVSGANFSGTYFDDQAAVPVSIGAAPFTGGYRPTQSLSAFNGKTANGTWRLIVQDLQAGPGGTARIDGFELTFAGTGATVTQDQFGIDDLYFVDAGQDLVIKAANANTVVTAGAVQSGYREANQNGAGIITSGFNHDGNPITIVGGGSNATGFGHGGTLRILGQANNPVLFTSLLDNTVGAGTIGNVQNLTGNDPTAQATAGSWTGIQLMPGSNTSKAVVVTQLPNGSINTRYADVNPYTLGDEPDTYFAGAQSYREHVLPGGLNDLAIGAPQTRIMMQDGSLIEFAEIRFAQVAIEQQGYPETKLQIESNELETNRGAPNESNPATATMQPLTHWISRDDGTWVFNTVSGAHRVGARMGGTSQNPLTGTDDVDWYEMPEPPNAGQTIQSYAEVQTGNTAQDANFNIFAFNSSFQLLYASGLGLFGIGGAQFLNSAGAPLIGAAATAAIIASAGALGPFNIMEGQQQHTLNNPQYDVQFVAVTPLDRLPRSFVPTTASPSGLLPQDQSITFRALPSSGPAGSNGFRIVQHVNTTDGSPVEILGDDSIWDPPGNSGSFLGGYEVEFRSENFGDRTNRPVRLAEGETIIRNNLIVNSSIAAIGVVDFREEQPSNANAGADIATQTVRFAQDNANQLTNSNGNPFINNDYFLPGTQIYNNLLVNNAGLGIALIEDAPDVGAGEPAANLFTPTMFASVYNNTIDAAGTGILYVGRGGANILNNIITNSTVGIQFAKSPDIEPLRPTIQPVVSYNQLFANTTNIQNSGSLNATQNLLNVDPRFVDRANFDYRLLVASPAVDSAISNLSDRLASTRFPQEPLRAPTTDFRGRSRVDNITRPNVGAGQFPFYDRGAFEATEAPLRVIGASVVTANQLIGQSVSQITLRFYGRVDVSTFTTSGSNATVKVTQGTATGPQIGIGLVTNSYDPTTNTHTFVLNLQQTLTSGTYFLTLKGTSSGTSDPGIRDISGNLLDGEFPAPYSFPSGNGISGGTFQYFFTIRTASVGGLVWNNVDGDGVVDAGENGLGGVGMQLTFAGSDGVFGTGDDQVLPQQSTSISGSYSFAGLQPGNYRLTTNPATIPSNFFLNTPPAVRTFTLGFGEDRVNENFGFWQDFSNASIGNLVWNDLNGDGVRQGSEPTLPAIIVQAQWAGRDRTFGTADDQTFTTSSTAAASDNFLFNANLPAGEYRVVVDPASLPAGFLRTTQLGLGEYPINVFLTPGGSFLGIQLGFQQKNSSIGDTVFNDLNANGVQDGGELGIAGVQVILTGPGGLVVVQNTNAGGGYNFTGLASGSYTVTVNAATLPANFYSTTNNSPLVVNLPDGNTQITNADFGYALDPLSGIIGSLVWNDADGNGLLNGSETGLAGVQVLVTWAGRDNVFGTGDDQNLPTQLTNGSGNYLFTGLAIGKYRVNTGTGVPAGFARTTPTTVPYELEIGDGLFGHPSNTNLTANFGYQAANSSLSGVVFNDLNGNGLLDLFSPAELGRFGGVLVFIDADNDNVYDVGVERFAVSNPGTGDWFISGLASGTYKVMIDPTTIPASPGGLVPSPLFLTVGVGPSMGLTEVNLGLFQKNSTVTGRIFNDANSNGTQDFGEGPLANVDVTLTWFGSNNVNENGLGDDQVFTTSTNASGDYTFSGLPGSFGAGANYFIQVDQSDVPAGSVPTVPNPPALNLTVGAGTTVTRNFGFRVPATSLPGLFYLALQNPGVLTNSNGVSQQFRDTDIIKLTTDPNGSYAYEVYFRGQNFGLAPGAEAIDAMTILNDGSILVSTVGTVKVSTNYAGGVGSGTTISGSGSDLLRFAPTAFDASGQIVAGTWSLYFRGSRVGLSGSAENVDAVSALYNAGGQVSSLLISTAGQASVKGMSANNTDVLKFNIQALGTNTQGTFEMYFKGSNMGLSSPTTENLDALFVSGGGSLPSLVISTSGNFSVNDANGTQSGNRNDAMQFNPTALGNGTDGTWGPVRLSGNSFGMNNANIRGIYIGAAPGDPSPLTAAGYTPGGENDLDKHNIRWAADRGTVNVLIDTGSFTEEQVGRIRDALGIVGQTFTQASGLTLVEVTDPNLADVRIGHSDQNGTATGLLGQIHFVYDTVLSGFTASGEGYRTFIGHEAGGLTQIDILSGWNFYAGADAKGIGANQYDFQTVVTHELGHALGLGEHRESRTQVMSETLRQGQVRRLFGRADIVSLEGLYTEQATTTVNAQAQFDGSTVANLQGTSPRARLTKTNLTQLVQETMKPLVANARRAAAAAADQAFVAGGKNDAVDLADFGTRARSIASKLASRLN